VHCPWRISELSSTTVSRSHTYPFDTPAKVGGKSLLAQRQWHQSSLLQVCYSTSTCHGIAVLAIGSMANDVVIIRLDQTIIVRIPSGLIFVPDVGVRAAFADLFILVFQFTTTEEENFG
jgi:hypothetical protein